MLYNRNEICRTSSKSVRYAPPFPFSFRHSRDYYVAFLASDNTSGTSAKIIEAVTLANTGNTKAYGADQYTELLTIKLRAIFEHPELIAFPVFNGSAANCLGLASIQLIKKKQPFAPYGWSTFCQCHSKHRL